MCGIAGVRKFGKIPITGEELTILLCSLEHRGPHATGMALQDEDGTIHVLKAAQPAWQFTVSDEYKAFLKEYLTEKTVIALLHDRWYTIGSPGQNKNNHPMWDGTTAVVHNGGITNHEFLFNSNKYERFCETDSDIIRAILAEHGLNLKGIRELNKMGGSAAIAGISQKEPGRLLLARSGSPLQYGFANDKMYWASETHAITAAYRPFYRVRGLWVQDSKASIALGHMPDNTAWLFNNNEWEAHAEFKTCVNYIKPSYTRTKETYRTKRKQWKTEDKQKAKRKEPIVVTKPTIVDSTLKGTKRVCTKCQAVNGNPKGEVWRNLVCYKCEEPLGW